MWLQHVGEVPIVFYVYLFLNADIGLNITCV